MIMDHQLILVLLCLIWFNDLNFIRKFWQENFAISNYYCSWYQLFCLYFSSSLPVFFSFFFLIWIVNYGIIHDKYYSNFFSNYLHVVPHLRREGNDSLNDETFGSSDSTSEDRAEEERKRIGICFLILEFFCKHQIKFNIIFMFLSPALFSQTHDLIDYFAGIYTIWPLEALHLHFHLLKLTLLHLSFSLVILEFNIPKLIWEQQYTGTITSHFYFQSFNRSYFCIAVLCKYFFLLWLSLLHKI